MWIVRIFPQLRLFLTKKEQDIFFSFVYLSYVQNWNHVKVEIQRNETNLILIGRNNCRGRSVPSGAGATNR